MVSVQRAKVEEAPEIKQALRETWLDTYSSCIPQDVIQRVTTLWHSPQLLASEIQNPKVFFGVAKDENNAILGLATARKRSADLVAVARLYVKPHYQRQGIGSQLLEASIIAFPGARRVRLEVEEQNEKGLSFYRKQGFKAISRHEERVEDITLTVIAMEKQLP